MKSYNFDNPVQAWSELNLKFIRKDPELFGENQGADITGSLFSYGITMLIENATFDPDFDFGKIMGYTQSKWSSLLNNYLDLDVLDQLKNTVRELEKNKAVNRNYHLAFSFADAHNNGKGCLVSGVFSRMIYIEKPRLTIVMRASEIVTRLPWDLLLACRLGEYVFGHTDFSIEVFMRSAWCDDISLMLYNGYQEIEPIINEIEDEERRKRLKKCLRKTRKAAAEGNNPNYQAYTRVYKVFNPEAFGKEAKSLFAKDCIIGNWDGIPLPPECPSIIKRNNIKKAFLAFTEKYGLNYLTGEVDKTKKSFKFNKKEEDKSDDLPFDFEEEPQEEDENED